MSAGRDDAAARQKALIEALDAIVARRSRGEITPEEAEAASDAVMRQAHAETVEWVRTTQEGRAAQRRLRLRALIVAIAVAALAFVLTRF